MANGPRFFCNEALGGFVVAALGFPDDKALVVIDTNVAELALRFGPVILWLALPPPEREEMALGRG